MALSTFEIARRTADKYATKTGKPRGRRTAPDKTGHKFGQLRDGAPLGDGATAAGNYDGGDAA